MAPAGCDIALGDAAAQAPGALGCLIVQHLAVKGFCVLDAGLSPEVLAEALKEAEDLERQQRFKRIHPIIAEGLLGPDGSGGIAELHLPDAGEDELALDGETLQSVDHTLSDLVFLVEPHISALGADLGHRTAATIHRCSRRADNAAALDPALKEVDVEKWLMQFVRHTLMVAIFLGPTDGVLTLEPYDTPDADPLRLSIWPGCVVVLRPDLMSHHFSSLGKSLTATCFCLDATTKRFSLEGKLKPAVSALDNWMTSRLKTLKTLETEETVWDAAIPRSWQKAMNHMFHKGELVGVRSISCKFPATDCVTSWFKASVAGPDYVTEVPSTRWDHSEIYDPDLESWKRHKSYCKHAAFIDGVEMFDCKMFDISPAEAKIMDPQQRLILETGYTAFASMGHTKKTLRNALCGVYVASGTDEWQHVNRKKDYGPFEATGSSLAIIAGRFSYIMALKGPALVFDNEGSSALTATYFAAESLQRRGNAARNDFSIALGVHLCLASMWWPSHCAAGWLSRKGRCSTFDASADGYVRGEGCAAMVLKQYSDFVGNAYVVDEEVASSALGCIAGARINSSGRSCGLSAPSGPAEQEAIVEALHNARVSPLDVDIVEVHGTGVLLADAVEAASAQKVHRDRPQDAGDDSPALALLAGKTSLGNQVECGGFASLFKALLVGRSGIMTPSLHLGVLNKHIDVSQPPVLLPTEVVDIEAPSTYAGVMARGFGGSNAYVLTWSEAADAAADVKARLEDDKGLSKRHAIQYWPAGGAPLKPDLRAREHYCVVGSWNNWQKGEPMEDEGKGIFGYTITLSETQQEFFQIWLDGDSTKVLHPGCTRGSKADRVHGPEDVSTAAAYWVVDARSELVGYCSPAAHRAAVAADGEPALALQAVQVRTPDAGLPGDTYRIRLRLSGCWRTVDWEKVERQDSEQSLRVYGRYAVVGSWNKWQPQQMAEDESAPGSFSAEVTASSDADEFQLWRNSDARQALYPPASPSSGSRSRPAGGSDAISEVALGPDSDAAGRRWSLQGSPGDVFRIELRLELDRPRMQVLKTVSWSKVKAAGTAAPPGADRRAYFLLGTWDGWQVAKPMRWDGSGYRAEVELGRHGKESFRVLQDGDREQVIHPNCQDASPHSFHVTQGPSPHASARAFFWTIGARAELDAAAPGKMYEVRLAWPQPASAAGAAGTTSKPRPRLTWSPLQA
eukprot:TRINITY_DN111235_c0_g1_i1.p1 TRINITY_DN111235_c0_g1~~TRINITY_DN111235_c0_g1_i1.p1  ORF type:complete len:1193 (-),score=289.97 TRINITY_DN111235_c0_g1_i1:44-3622(-)